MAVRTPTITFLNKHQDDGHIVSWAGLTNASSDTGLPVEMIGESDRSVQISGTFGSGGTVLIEGSNDGTTYATLKDLQGSDLSFTAAGLKGVAELPRYIRPRVSAGDGTTSLIATMLMKLVR